RSGSHTVRSASRPRSAPVPAPLASTLPCDLTRNLHRARARRRHARHARVRRLQDRRDLLLLRKHSDEDVREDLEALRAGVLARFARLRVLVPELAGPFQPELLLE